ncbi:TPA: hypothetical protein ACWLT0_002893 [Pseudomonas aeruginosa]
MLTCQAIALLPGWMDSKGARLEPPTWECALCTRSTSPVLRRYRHEEPGPAGAERGRTLRGVHRRVQPSPRLDLLPGDCRVRHPGGP